MRVVGHFGCETAKPLLITIHAPFLSLLSSFGEERENYFVGRLPKVAPKAFGATAGLIAFAPFGASQFGFARI